ncbi:MAG: hypothetical protein IJZ10_12525, partial [Thermoguttaceae bacterium]|nr:hypothetical protein [Thermoguttaceae bacterium]
HMKTGFVFNGQFLRKNHSFAFSPILSLSLRRLDGAATRVCDAPPGRRRFTPKSRRATRSTERALTSNVVKNVFGTRLNAFALELEEGNPAKTTSSNYLP